MSSITTPPGRSEAPPAVPARDRRRRSRTLWRALGSVVVAVLLLGGVYQVVVALAHEDETVHRQFDAQGITAVEVRNGADGSVHVSGGSGRAGTIDVTAHVSHGLRPTSYQESVQQGRLVLESTCPIYGTSFCNVSYTVAVPSGVDVLVRSDSGPVTVTGVAGDVDVGVDSGHIRLSGIGGSVRSSSDSGGIDAAGLTGDRLLASTDSGSISVSFDQAPRAVSAGADSGSVTVLVPDDGTAYLVDTDTDSGRQVIGVPTDPGSERSIVARTDSGDVTVDRTRSG